jgi:hypothetical protein
LALPLGYIAYVQHLGLPQELSNCLHNPVPLLRRLPVLLGGPLGTAAYLYGMQLSGLGSVNETYEGPIWRTQIVMPWESLLRAVQVIVQGTASSNDVANIASFVFAVVLAIVVTLRFKPPYWLYIWPTLGFILLRGHYLIQLHGMLRYTLYLFPIFIALAVLLERKTVISHIAQLTYLVGGFGMQVALVVSFSGWLWVS